MGRRIIAAFIAPDDLRWQGSLISVADDGSWWRWSGSRWEEELPPVPFPEEPHSPQPSLEGPAHFPGDPIKE